MKSRFYYYLFKINVSHLQLFLIFFITKNEKAIKHGHTSKSSLLQQYMTVILLDDETNTVQL